MKRRLLQWRYIRLPVDPRHTHQVPGWWLVVLLIVLLIVTACATEETPSARQVYATLTPSPTPTATPSPSPTPTPLPYDINPHQQVMRPEFVEDVQTELGRNIPRYTIDVRLLLSPNQAPTLRGSMTVQYANRQDAPLDEIYLRLLPNLPSYGGQMQVTSATADGQALDIPTAQDDVLALSLPAPLPPGGWVELALTYEATLPETLQQGYGLFGRQDDVIALGGFYPLIPAYTATGWHLDAVPLYGDATHTEVAFYDVTVTVPANMVVAATGDRLAGLSNDANEQSLRFFSGPVRDFFVILSPNFETVSADYNGTTVTSYYLSGQQTQGEFVLDVSTNALQSFSEYFGPYPYRALDVVAAPMPDALGGIEYPGIVTVAQRYYDQPNAFWEFVTAHEIGHQWWYGLVGSDQVNHPWLDEALTQYSTIHYYEDRYGQTTAAAKADEMFNSQYDLLLNTSGDLPAAGGVGTFNEADYSLAVYGKGPIFFRSLRQTMGDSRYFAALRNYLDQHRYGIVEPRDLLDAFAAFDTETTMSLYYRWIGGE